ncbi:MAG TPA: hypothetical protein VFK33_08465 [Bacillales bacterium]|nr:hypothetical protein [Bacillales bacterium]
MKSFWIFWSGRTISSYGDALFRIAMPWFALQLGGVWMVAVVVTVATAVKPLGSYIMAPWITRSDCRLVLIRTDYLRAIVNLGFGVLAAAGGISGPLLITLVMILVAANAFLMGWFDIGMQMYIPTITEELRAANADLATGKNVVELLGYLTGGFMTSWMMTSGFSLNAFTFLLAGMAMFWAGGGKPVEKTDRREGRKTIFQSLFGQWREARSAILSSARLQQIFGLSLVLAVCFAPIGTMLAPLAEKSLGGGPLLLGILEGSLAAGGILAGLGMRKSKWTDLHTLMAGAGICAMAEVISGLFAVPIVVIAAIGLFGAGQTLFSISEDIVLQSTNSELRAPVFAVITVLVTVLYPLASLATAQIVRITSISVPFVTGGFLAFVFVLFLWLRKTA